MEIHFRDLFLRINVSGDRINAAFIRCYVCTDTIDMLFASGINT